MADLELTALTASVAPHDPCGPDLDAVEDDDYMNFMVSSETILPADYVVYSDYVGLRQPFYLDRRYKDLDLGAVATAAEPFLGRTRDLRLLVLVAKLQVLNKRLAAFVVLVEAIAVLLETRWSDVHPRGLDGDFEGRRDVLQRLDDPLITSALQNVPLFSNKRYGAVTFQIYLAETKQSAGADKEPDTTAIDKVLADEGQSDLASLLTLRDQLAPTRDTLDRLRKALARIRTAWMEGADDAGLKLLALPRLAEQIFAFVDRIEVLTEGAIVRVDPSAARAPREPTGEPEGIAEAEPSGAEDGVAIPRVAATPSPALATPEAAVQALVAVTAYFAASEPSNPALLLLRQAQALVGKSFIEAMQILVPDQVQKASLSIGTLPLFTLPLTRLAETGPAAKAAPPAANGEANAAEPRIVSSREQAVALLDQVGAFYRRAEPSSPIPLLTERARALAGKDFLSLLGDVLPKEPPPAAKPAKP